MIDEPKHISSYVLHCVSINQNSRCRQLTSVPPVIDETIPIDASDDEEDEQMNFLVEWNTSYTAPQDWWCMTYDHLKNQPHLIPASELVYPTCAPRRGFRNSVVGWPIFSPPVMEAGICVCTSSNGGWPSKRSLQKKSHLPPMRGQASHHPITDPHVNMHYHISCFRIGLPHQDLL